MNWIAFLAVGEKPGGDKAVELDLCEFSKVNALLRKDGQTEEESSAVLRKSRAKTRERNLFVDAFDSL